MQARSHSSRSRLGEAFHAHPALAAGLLELAPVRNSRKGTVLFHEGDPAIGVYLLLHGRARLSLHADDGRNIVLRTVKTGYILGLPGTIMRTNYLFTAELLENSEVAFVPAPEVLEFLRDHSDLCYDVVEMLGGELLDLPAAVHRPAIRSRKPRTNA